MLPGEGLGEYDLDHRVMGLVQDAVNSPRYKEVQNLTKKSNYFVR